jgi:hypothetical protein
VYTPATVKSQNQLFMDYYILISDGTYLYLLGEVDCRIYVDKIEFKSLDSVTRMEAITFVKDGASDIEIQAFTNGSTLVILPKPVAFTPITSFLYQKVDLKSPEKRDIENVYFPADTSLGISISSLFALKEIVLNLLL